MRLRRPALARGRCSLGTYCKKILHAKVALSPWTKVALSPWPVASLQPRLLSLSTGYEEGCIEHLGPEPVWHAYVVMVHALELSDNAFEEAHEVM